MSTLKTPSLLIGVDPGLHGALAFMDMRAGVVAVYDFPLLKKPTGRKDKKGNPTFKSVIDYPDLMDILSSRNLSRAAACVEYAHAFPGQGGVSNWTFSGIYHFTWAFLSALCPTVITPTPMTWQKYIVPGVKGRGKLKQAVADKVAPLYPTVELLDEKNKLLDGRSDALGILTYLKDNIGDFLK